MATNHIARGRSLFCRNPGRLLSPSIARMAAVAKRHRCVGLKRIRSGRKGVISR
jgi:hypothetical protein